MVMEGRRLQGLVESHERPFEWFREDGVRVHEDVARMRDEAARRERALDERLDRLVSAIGALASEKRKG
jgi:hypothetical protein